MKTEDGKYVLEIVGKNENGKTFKEYKLDGHDKIGVHENEPFIIRFKNNTWKSVQVRISVDGTDVLTGNLAHTEPTPDGMWVVQGYKTMELSAWPETNEGGAEFIFGQTKNSVASNTHGNLSAKGLIAVAVFEEEVTKHMEFSNSYRFRYSWDSKGIKDETICEGITYGSSSGDYAKPDSITYDCNESDGLLGINEGERFSYNNSEGTNCFIKCSNVNTDAKRRGGPAVGAGSYVTQNITKTAGLVRPTLSCILQVKYEWWESLRSSLRKEYSAFPGNKKEKFINLGKTPRMQRNPQTKHVEYSRFL